MKFSREWLQSFFDGELPKADALADALTFHAFEIEGMETRNGDDILDVKVTANRGHDCLSHRGLAKELSAILSLSLRTDPLRAGAELSPKTDTISVVVEKASFCPRYIACHIRGVRVGPSPEWLAGRIEAIGQRSINNIVDATNFVMFALGQPLHAFDASKLMRKDGSYAISIRRARGGEHVAALDGKNYPLTESMLAIVDRHAGVPVGIAGVKGGDAAGVTEATTDIIIESANFNGASVRKTAQALKLRTDASVRFEQGLSPELAAYGMRAVADLILEIAGGELLGFADVYDEPQKTQNVRFSAEQTSAVLGTDFSVQEIEGILKRLDLPFVEEKGTFTVSPPFERLDLLIPEDLIEEVGRIAGYERIPSAELPPFPRKPEISKEFYWSEKVRDFLVSKGFSEVFTPLFAEEGKREVLNKVGGNRPYLRGNLENAMTLALERNSHSAELLGLSDIRLFELGIVFDRQTEYARLVFGIRGKKSSAHLKKITDEFGDIFGVLLEPKESGGVSLAALDFKNLVEANASPSEYERAPLSSATKFQAFSRFPYILRDIALWVPLGAVESGEVEAILRAEAGPLLVRLDMFDAFEKEVEISYAFRLIFQSYERTLSDEEVNKIMEKIAAKLGERGWRVR